MDFDVETAIQDEQQFWDELEEIVNAPCGSSQISIDTALKHYLALTADYAHEYLQSAYDWRKCAVRLLWSPMFENHKTKVRRRLISRLRKEHSSPRLHLCAAVLLLDGGQSQKVFEWMKEEGLFLRCVELLMERKEDDRLLWDCLLDLLYEMSKASHIRKCDLAAVDDSFVQFLFDLVEEDAEEEDPYHFRLIRILLVLNEQYLLAAHTPPTNGAPATPPPTNRVIKTLCYCGSSYKTFGANIVYLLNRETETSLQLLILKLLYLLFTTSATYEYFYTNDLRVLVDVIIRNLYDMPDELQDLRHTYLRVLYPLLSHTQLRHAPYYKRDEILDMLLCLSCARSMHFQPIDDTTVRLSKRCASVGWLAAALDSPTSTPENPAQRLLGMSLGGDANQSSLSVVQIAAQSEPAGVHIPVQPLPRKVGSISA